MGLWDNARKELINKSQTRIFTKEIMNTLEKRAEEYLLNLSPIKPEIYEKIKRENIQNIKEIKEYDYSNDQEIRDYGPSDITSQEKVEVMVTALFEKFFTPINTKQWLEDRAKLYFVDQFNEKDMTSINIVQAIMRLESHNKNAYYKEKNNFRK